MKPLFLCRNYLPLSHPPKPKHQSAFNEICVFTKVLSENVATLTRIPRKENTYLVTNEDSSKSILKTFCFDAEDKWSIEIQRNLFNTGVKAAAETEHITKPLKICEETQDGNIFMEVLIEWPGEPLLRGKPPNASHILNWAKQTLKGQSKAVKKNVYHFGIKPGTLGWNKGLLKISDVTHNSELENAKSLIKCTKSPYINAERFCYFPPEILNESGYYDEMVDVYCWGMHFYRIISGKGLKQMWEECESFKIKDKNYSKFMKEVSNLKIEGVEGKLLESKLIPILKDVLVKEENSRPTFDSLYKIVSEISIQ